VLNVSKQGRYSSLPKKRTCECGLLKKVSRRSKSSRKGKGLRKGERRSSRKGQKSAESRALCLLSAVGATGVPVVCALEHRGRRMRS